MTSNQTESTINTIEEFIESHNSNNLMPSISESHRETTIINWKIINDSKTPNTTYLNFASSSSWMISYGFYKSRKGEIFIIDTFCGELQKYHKVDSTWVMLIPYEEFIKQLFE